MQFVTMHVQFPYVLFSFIHVSAAWNYEETINYYVNLVENGIENAFNFELPVDASMHRPVNSKIKGIVYTKLFVKKIA